MGQQIDSYPYSILVDRNTLPGGDTWWTTSSLLACIADGSLADWRFDGPIPRELVIERLFKTITTSRGLGAGLFPIEDPLTATGPVVLINEVWYEVTVATGRFGTAVRQCSPYDCSINYIGGEGYQIHDETEWLMDTLPGLDVSAAGKLPDGTTWVQYSHNEIMSKHVGHANKLIAVTGNNGRLATSVRQAFTVAQCTNTFAMAMGEGKQGAIKVKHTKNSAKALGSIQESIDTLAMMSERIDLEIDRLMSVSIADGVMMETIRKFLGARPADQGRGQTEYDKAFSGIVAAWHGSVGTHLVTHDNTAYNALQAYDTYRQWGTVVRGAPRQARQDELVINGKGNDANMAFMNVLAGVYGDTSPVPAF